jgi:hypothetical protein
VEGDLDAQGGKQLAFSIAVESLPRELRSDMALFAFFEELFPGQVRAAPRKLPLVLCDIVVVVVVVAGGCSWRL